MQRVYLENDLSNDDVANLIMIGTPNQGSPLALGSLTIPLMIYLYLKDFICWPAVYDLIPGSAATTALENENTEYYTIDNALNTGNKPEILSLEKVIIS